MKGRYLTRGDLNKRIFGLEQYKPGDFRTRHLFIGITGGSTTGVPTMVVINNEYYIHTQEFKNCFLEPPRSYLRISPRYDSCLSAAHTLLYFSQNIEQFLCVDRCDIDSPILGKLLSEFRPTEIKSTPSFFQKFLEALSPFREIDFLKRVVTLIFSGEKPGNLHKKNVRKALPNAKLISDYSSAESGHLTTSCGFLRTKYADMSLSVFHPLPSRNITLADVDENGVGEIVISTPELLNYRHGDFGKLKEEVCPCGAQQTLVLCGRKDLDVVFAAGAVFKKQAVEDVFSRLKEDIAEFRVEVSEVGRGAKVLGHVTAEIVPAKNSGLEPLANRIRGVLEKKLYVTPTRTLGELVSEGIFLPTSVTFANELFGAGKRIILRKV